MQWWKISFTEPTGERNFVLAHDGFVPTLLASLEADGCTTIRLGNAPPYAEMVRLKKGSLGFE